MAEPSGLWMYYSGVAYSTVHVAAEDLAAVALVAEDSVALVAEDSVALEVVVDLAQVEVGLEEVGKLLTRPKNFFPMPVSSLL